MLPFTQEQFFDAFARYNEAVWPAQIGLVAIAVGAVVLALRGGPSGGRVKERRRRGSCNCTRSYGAADQRG